MSSSFSQIKSLLGTPSNRLLGVALDSRTGVGNAFDSTDYKLVPGSSPWFNIYSAVSPGGWEAFSGALFFGLKRAIKMSDLGQAYNHAAIVPYCDFPNRVLVSAPDNPQTVCGALNLGELYRSITARTHVKAVLGNFSSAAYALDSFNADTEKTIEIPVSGINVSQSADFRIVLCDWLGRNEVYFPTERFPTFSKTVLIECQQDTQPTISYSIEMDAEIGNKLQECVVMGTQEALLAVGAMVTPVFSFYCVANESVGSVFGDLRLYRNGTYETSYYFYTDATGRTIAVFFSLRSAVCEGDRFTLSVVA